MNAITLTVPAEPGYVHVLRSVMSGVAAHHALSIDAIEDLRLAVDEACSYLLGAAGERPTELRLTIIPGGDRLEVVASIGARDERRRAPDAQQGVMWHILAALADEARLQEQPDGPAIHLTKLLNR